MQDPAMVPPSVLPSFRRIGKAFRKVDATAKVTGVTKFADDLFLPRMLFARVLRSTQPHARIRRIDVSRALALDGVHAVLTGRDLPIPFGILPVSQDEHALALDKVRFVGDPVAAVAARSEEIATAALDLSRSRPSRRRRTQSRPRTRASTTTDTGAISTRSSPSNSATWSAASPRRIWCVRTCFSSRGARTSPWSSTRPWRTGRRTAS